MHRRQKGMSKLLDMIAKPKFSIGSGPDCHIPSFPQAEAEKEIVS
jgi:hypothetical protein